MSEPRTCATCKHLAIQPGPEGPESICSFNPPTATIVPHVTLDANGNPTNVRIIARMSAFPTVTPKMFCSKWQRKLEVAGGEVVDLVEAQRNRD